MQVFEGAIINFICPLDWIMGCPRIWQSIIFACVYEDVSRWNERWNWRANAVIWFALPNVCGHHWIWTFEELNRSKRWRKKEFIRLCLIAWAETSTVLYPWDSWFSGFRLGLKSASLLSSLGLWTRLTMSHTFLGFWISREPWLILRGWNLYVVKDFEVHA